MIPSSNSSLKRSGTLNHYVGDLLHTMGDFQAVPRVNQGLLPTKFHENNSESKAEWERLRSGEIDFAVEKLRLSARLIRSARG